MFPCKNQTTNESYSAARKNDEPKEKQKKKKKKQKKKEKKKKIRRKRSKDNPSKAQPKPPAQTICHLTLCLRHRLHIMKAKSNLWSCNVS